MSRPPTFVWQLQRLGCNFAKEDASKWKEKRHVNILSDISIALAKNNNISQLLLVFNK